MTDTPDAEFPRETLCEMAPRLRILAESMPKYVAELELWQQKAREYGERHARPRALDIDRKCSGDPRYFDWELIRRSAPYGFCSMLVPRGAGGGGQLSTAMAIVMEELCAACPGIANIFGASGLGISAILLSMDFTHFDRALADVARGDRDSDPVLCAAAITEPGAGSDEEDAGCLRTARLVTEARPRPGGYVLNGRKVFISNGSVATYVAVVAPLDRSRPVETQSAFLVRRGDAGFSVGRVEDKMGMKACPAAELVFEECFVPEKNRIGRENEGVRFTEIGLGASRGPVGAIATGTARAAFERVVAFAKRKRTGGRRLIDQQWVQIRLADMARRIHLARQAYLDACMSFDFLGMPRLLRLPAARLLLDALPRALRRTSLFEKAIRSERAQQAVLGRLERHVDPADLRRIQFLSSAAKVSGSDLAVEVAYEALQIAGLESGLHRCELEKIYRDAKLTQIYEGTNQINRHNMFVNTRGKGNRL